MAIHHAAGLAAEGPTDCNAACRPFPRPGAPTGPVELYLDVRDVSGADWQERLARAWRQAAVPAETVILIEGPIRSLDGAYFDLTRAADADYEAD